MFVQGAIVKDKLYIDGGDLMFLEQLQFGGVRRDESKSPLLH